MGLLIISVTVTITVVSNSQNETTSYKLKFYISNKTVNST